MGPRSASTVLAAEQEAVAVAFRQQTQLPLDDCLYTLQDTLPPRSALHRLFQHHGSSRLPRPEANLPAPSAGGEALQGAQSANRQGDTVRQCAPSGLRLAAHI
jgi:hypothetical protein